METFLKFVFEANGGIGFFQDLALIGSVYGYVDVVVRLGDGNFGRGSSAPVKNGRGQCQGGRGAVPLSEVAASSRGYASAAQSERELLEAAKGCVLEIVEPTKAVPVLSEEDYRRLDAYMLNYQQDLNAVEEESVWRRVGRQLAGRPRGSERRARVERTQVWTPEEWLEFEGLPGERLIGRELNVLGRVPVVHIQNLTQPFFYEGLSEVEPLIPLQDELNTRLSDRANRVTFQSFKMYLGKGIDEVRGAASRAGADVGDGQPGGDDSGVRRGRGQPVGRGAHQRDPRCHGQDQRGYADRGGAAARQGGQPDQRKRPADCAAGLAREDGERKRVNYGAGIERLCELVLHAADVLGVLENRPEERTVRIDWPSPLPENEGERLRDAKLKLELGVPAAQVLTELGYGNP